MAVNLENKSYNASIPEKNNGNIPSFLNKVFFEKVFKNSYENVKIKQISMGSEIGENYFSAIYRVLLDVKNVENSNFKEISLIVKYLPIEGRRPFGETLKIYPKEIEMYEKVIPKLENISNVIFAPKYYTTTLDPTKTIIFQDIKSNGYSLANRQIGLDENQSKLVLKKIAIFHAASMVLSKKHPESMNNFNTGFIHENNRDTTLQKNIFEGNIECIADLIESWNGYEDISKKLRIIKMNFFEKCLNVTKSNDDTLKVLNHGDLHVNNFMFKYDTDDGKPSDVLFFDFQLSHFASLGLDINYFLNTSVQLNILKEKRKELIASYYSSLKMTLMKLQSDEKMIPSFDTVCKEIASKEFYGFFAFEGILPTLTMNPNDCKMNNVDQYSSVEVLKMRRKIMFSTERYLETMKYSLARFNDLGVLDL